MSNKIAYAPEKRWPECRDTRTLPFDFYIPVANLCIEFDGPQHFSDMNWYGSKIGSGKFELIQKHDIIKNEFCKATGIKLLRISYLELAKVEELLEQELGQYRIFVQKGVADGN